MIMFSFFRKNKKKIQEENQKYLQEIGHLASELKQQAQDTECQEKLDKIKELSNKVKP
jgi:predicted GTPase